LIWQAIRESDGATESAAGSVVIATGLRLHGKSVVAT